MNGGFLYFYEIQDSVSQSQPPVQVEPLPKSSKPRSTRGTKRKSIEAHTTCKDPNPPKRSARRKTTTDLPDPKPKPPPAKSRRKSAPVAAESVSDDEYMNDKPSSGDNEEFDYHLRRLAILKAGIKIDKELQKLQLSEPCIICQEKWFDLKLGSRNQTCPRCQGELNNTREKQYPTFSAQNDLIPSKPPEEVSCLNDIELNSIKLIVPMMHFYKRQSGSRGSRGNCIGFNRMSQHLLRDS